MVGILEIFYEFQSPAAYSDAGGNAIRVSLFMCYILTGGKLRQKLNFGAIYRL